MKNLFSHAMALSMMGAALFCTLSFAQAQESLAGIGAASGIGASLGAAAGSSITGSSATRNVDRGGSREMTDEPDSGTSFRSTKIREAGAGNAAAPVAIVQRSLNWGTSGQSYVNELLNSPRRMQPIPERVRRTSRAQSRYSRRISRLSAKARAKLVAQKYKIAPRSWLASYLPQDRYKFGKVWRFVSTESDRFYYRPADMARRRFNPNRVIGFNSFQDALIAGYRPDPVSKPEPGNGLAVIAGFTRGPQFYRYVEFVYAGQVSPASFNATYRYALNVNRALRPVSYARGYIGSTVEKVLEASISGDTSIIPTSFESPLAQTARIEAARTIATAPGTQGPSSGAGLKGNPGGMGDKREEEYNNFGRRAGNLARVPANQ